MISYADLLARLQMFTAADLERPARVMITGQSLAIRAVLDEADSVPLLDTGVLMVSLDSAEE